MRRIKSLWIEAEQWEDGWDRLDDNTDVVAELYDGTRWVATFFTFRNIVTLSSKNAETGECLGGKYFWASDLILIDEMTRERIWQVLEDLIETGEFESALNLIEP